MKYTLPKINLKDYTFTCEVKRHECTYTNYLKCEKCKNDFISCWTNELKRDLNCKCQLRNATKYILIKNPIHSRCNKMYSHIGTDKSLKIELYCEYCESRQEVTNDIIKELLKDEYEYLDNDEFDTLIHNSLINAIETKPQYERIENCLFCNKEFIPMKKGYVACPQCYKEHIKFNS